MLIGLFVKPKSINHGISSLKECFWDGKCFNDLTRVTKLDKKYYHSLYKLCVHCSEVPHTVVEYRTL